MKTQKVISVFVMCILLIFSFASDLQGKKYALKGKSQKSLRYGAKSLPVYTKMQPVRDAKIGKYDMDSAMALLRKDMIISWKQIRYWNSCFSREKKD